MNQRPLFDLSRIPSKPAAPVDAPPERKHAGLEYQQERLLAHILDGRGMNYLVAFWWDKEITWLDWYELHLRGFVEKDEYNLTVITAHGIEYLTERDWL